KREQWGGQIEFLLSCIGYCVGLGNVWRFPYLAYENGGGAFLIPYIIMLVLCGIPLFMMELSFGQFAGLGPITAWRSVPLFKGVGFGMVAVSFLVCIYYNVIIAWSLFYLFASFSSVLPWTQCDQWWNKASYYAATTVSSNITANKTRIVSTTEEYWNYRVLRIDQSSGIGDPGIVLWDLVLCLLLAWIIVFACLCKGVKSTGKVVYFTATFPYIILIILLVRGCTLEGAVDGIVFYVRPDWERLKDSTVWTAAATQIFYSLGVSFGGLLTFASYNKFSNNIYRDTLIVSLGNCATSVFAGFVIFSVIGHMAFKVGQKVEDVIDHGMPKLLYCPGLAFIAYPQAVALLPVPQLWSILFFFMLLTLGLDSQFAMLETVVTGFIDEFPRHLRKRKMLFTLFVAVVAFLLGILCVTEGGMYWFNLYNFYSAYYGLLALSLIMCVVINWGYGKWRFNTDIKLMLGFEPNWYFKGAWMGGYSCRFLIIYDAINASPITYGSYEYPKWADDLGICMSVTCVATVPLYALWRIIVAYRKGEKI
uniref:Transporter n=1 Tax=Ciona savignyi TaxID=51511 RepID=H2ZGW8_CIOSA